MTDRKYFDESDLNPSQAACPESQAVPEPDQTAAVWPPPPAMSEPQPTGAPPVPWMTHIMSGFGGMVLSCIMLVIGMQIHFPGRLGLYVIGGSVVVIGCLTATKHRAVGVGIVLFPALIAAAALAGAVSGP